MLVKPREPWIGVTLERICAKVIWRGITSLASISDKLQSVGYRYGFKMINEILHVLHFTLQRLVLASKCLLSRFVWILGLVDAVQPSRAALLAHWSGCIALHSRQRWGLSNSALLGAYSDLSSSALIACRSNLGSFLPSRRYNRTPRHAAGSIHSANIKIARCRRIGNGTQGCYYEPATLGTSEICFQRQMATKWLYRGGLLAKMDMKLTALVSEQAKF